MAGLLDFFTGGSDADLYGGLLNEQQRSALATRGLASMAEKFGQLAMPQRAPIPLGAVLGQGFGAYGAGTDEAVKTAFEARYKGAQAQQLQSQIEYAKGLAPLLGPLGDMLTKLQGGGTSGGAMPGSGSTGGAAVSPSAGGGGDPSEADIIGRESGGKPYVGYGGVDLSNAPLNEYGFPIWAGKMGPAGISHAAGLYQFQPGTWATYAGPLGIKDFSPESQRKVYLAARAAEGARPWAASAGAPSARSAAPTAGAPAPAGGGGLLNLPDPTGRARLLGGPAADATAPAPPGASINDAANQILKGWTAGNGNSAATPGQGASAEEPPGFAGRQLVAQLGAGVPLADVSQYRQVAGPGGGEPTGMVSGLLTPGGPLTRGDVPNMPAMPAAPTPANDPGLQLGPLAPAPAAAPAAAAPAAAGPGLLSPQGAAPAAALPQVNPAYGNVLAQIARLRAQSELAGIKNDPFAAFASALKDSPAYQAQIELAKRLGVFPLIAPEAAAKAGAEEPYKQRQALFESDLARRNAYAAQGLVLDATGKVITDQPGYSDAKARIAEAEAAAKARATFPYDVAKERSRFENVRPGGTVYDPLTGKPAFTAPDLKETIDPNTGQKSFVYVTPQSGQATGLVSGLGPGQIKTLEQTAAAQPISVQGGPGSVMNTGPGYTEPVKTEDGSLIPPAAGATPIRGPKEYLDQRAKDYAKTEDAWGTSVQSAAEATQRLQAITTAMKDYQTGAYASNLSDIRAALKNVGINLPDSIAGDPAQAQIILKNNFAAAIQTMKATGLSRWTQAELFSSQANMANPNLQPAANLAIAAQTIGALAWEQQMQKDFAQAKRYGGWLDPQDFQAQWVRANPLQPFVDKAEKQIGPLKGMEPPTPAAPAQPSQTRVYNPQTKTFGPPQ